MMNVLSILLLMTILLIPSSLACEKQRYKIICWKDSLEDYIEVKRMDSYAEALVYAFGKDCRVEEV